MNPVSAATNSAAGAAVAADAAAPGGMVLAVMASRRGLVVNRTRAVRTTRRVTPVPSASRTLDGVLAASVGTVAMAVAAHAVNNVAASHRPAASSSHARSVNRASPGNRVSPANRAPRVKADASANRVARVAVIGTVVAARRRNHRSQR